MARSGGIERIGGDFGVTVESVGIENSLDVRIDPATLQLQQAIEALLTSIDGQLTVIDVVLAAILVQVTPPGPQVRLLDYDTRTDYQMVYTGVAAQGTAEAASLWSITKQIYDGSNRMVSSEEMQNVAWTSRAALGWSY